MRTVVSHSGENRNRNKGIALDLTQVPATQAIKADYFAAAEQGDRFTSWENGGRALFREFHLTFC